MTRHTSFHCWRIATTIAVAALLLPTVGFAQQTQNDRDTSGARQDSQSTQRQGSQTTQPRSSTDNRQGTDVNRRDLSNTRDQADDRTGTRTRQDDNRFDRDDDRFDRNDNRFDRDDDVFDRDNRFDRSDDRFDRDDNRFDRDRDSDVRNRDDRDTGRDINIGANFSTDASDRLIVRSIQSRGILANAGLRQNDVIVTVDGRTVTSPTLLERVLIAADGRVPVVVLRDGIRQTIYIDDVRQQRYRTDYDNRVDQRYRTFDSQRAWLGVYLDTRYDQYAVVQSVQDGSAADDAGIRAGDWIISVNNRRVQSPSHLSQLVGNMEPGDPLDLEVARWDRRQVETKLDERPSSAQRFRYLDDDDAANREDRDRNSNRSSRNFDDRDSDRNTFDSRRP